MYKKFSQLSFIIGLFFTLVSFVLFVNHFLNKEQQQLNLYTAIAFLIFGVFMMLVKNTGESKSPDKLP